MESSNPTIGTKIGIFVDKLDSESCMNEDNKKMLEKVKKATSEKEVIKTLFTDPDTGRTMSYDESRMRFG
uniref:Uncharacterized protein n=1 Tax=viral metagenome TaxID=1070528 RepID=A0A6C0KHX6_9ZZZZ